ncbi:MAG TPA: hypothetical protein VMO47_14625 [Rhodothermales bacterium]|nr:hypothetical protein [Rhodothermales bacterium]
MKLRLRTNSIRLRLTKSEVDELVSTGTVTELVSFGPDPEQQLMYAVEARESDKIGCDYLPGSITVHLPSHDAATWAQSDQVGFNVEINVGAGETLTVIVEKDFKCLSDRPGEDESDAYPHPEEAKDHTC